MQLFYRVLHSCGIFFAAISVFYASPAAAQATRTWVSGVGDDVNPCSRTAPCLTFAGALSKTVAGGEINCLDAGGFGILTITKSITIDCTGTFGSILVSSSSSGIIVNGAGINVVLRGLAINGGTLVQQSSNGVLFASGASLTIIDSTITNVPAPANSGNGIWFGPNTTAELHVVNTVIANNRVGIFVRPSGSGAANVTLDRVTVVNSRAEGLRVVAEAGSSGPGTFLIATDSTFSGNTKGVSLETPAGITTFAVLKLVRSTITGNSGVGLLANGPTVRADVSGSTINNNGTGVSAVDGAILLSYLDNRVDRNGAGGDGAFTGSVSNR